MILISLIADDHAEASINFNKDTFAEDVEKTPHLVMFYAPWYVFNLSDSDKFLFNPIPTGHGLNQPIYSYHVTQAGGNRVKRLPGHAN